MTPSLSLFLDLVRVLAAFAVFLSHASWHDHTGGLMWQLGGIGREAVDVFFVLSGFVIAHAAGREGALGASPPPGGGGRGRGGSRWRGGRGWRRWRCRRWR